MAGKKKEVASAAAPARTQHQASSSSLPPGKGTQRIETRLIGIYGPPKARKTGSCAYLPMGRTKWLVSDSNCAATLYALDRMPAAEDFHEVSTLDESNEFLEKAIAVARDEGPEALGIDYLVNDSLTQTFEWAQRETAVATGQEFLGQKKGWDSNGYQEFNAKFLRYLDLLATLSRYVTVICIAHSKELFEKQKKGEFGGINMGGAMALAFGRKCNWLLLKTFEVLGDDGTITEDDMTKKVIEPGDVTVFERSCLLTRSTLDGYTAVANLRPQNRERSAWPGDIRALLKAEGIFRGGEYEDAES